MEFDNLDSRPGKSLNFGPGPGKSWNFMLANLYAAELPTVLDCLTCMRGKNIKLRQSVNLLGLCRRFPRPHDSLYSETVLSPPRFNINCTRQVAAHLLRCIVSSFFIRCSLQIEPIVNRVMHTCQVLRFRRSHYGFPEKLKTTAVVRNDYGFTLGWGVLFW